ncbi:antiporter inner membrane protein [Aquimixticola soesokkakensis]|uniref:Iron-sulfur cluster carrier protein n=1 Tax=Aquimixticola soesokkakensis TaxID=1519096 RepID=A0A1Y5S9N9_9RHOB|nr:Mrp/NBP35 family ATP-binding protein [Aquimixticola soesokkakensis]SLN35376.1 antiporter inner membrane protein [Aquimixticola soesokkakensis]
MSVNHEEILNALRGVELPFGGDPVTQNMIRALDVSGNIVRFVLEAPSADQARKLEPARMEMERKLLALTGVEKVSIVITAHGPAQAAPTAPSAPPATPSGQPPALKIGRHPTPQAGKQGVPGIKRILAVASGKGGVGKSTVSSNLAVALARQGRRVGLLDADIYGPSQPRMMGVTKKPASPDGQTIEPLDAHGVTMMSIGLMVKEDEAIVWRGPMLMGALQQMLGQVQWGELDVLIIDLPPGTGDVQLTLCQKTQLSGAIVVSTPQDVALLDARRAISMFDKLSVPVLGLIENMSTYICPQCGHEAHIFGHGGVAQEAAKINVPFLGALPLALDTRLAGDSGTPIAAGESDLAAPYLALAERLVGGGMA